MVFSHYASRRTIGITSAAAVANESIKSYYYIEHTLDTQPMTMLPVTLTQAQLQ